MTFLFHGTIAARGDLEEGRVQCPLKTVSYISSVLPLLRGWMPAGFSTPRSSHMLFNRTVI